MLSIVYQASTVMFLCSTARSFVVFLAFSNSISNKQMTVSRAACSRVGEHTCITPCESQKRAEENVHKGVRPHALWEAPSDAVGQPALTTACSVLLAGT